MLIGRNLNIDIDILLLASKQSAIRVAGLLVDILGMTQLYNKQLINLLKKVNGMVFNIKIFDISRTSCIQTRFMMVNKALEEVRGFIINKQAICHQSGWSAC